MQTVDRVAKEAPSNEALGKVRETRDLLEMLEYLFSKVSERSGENGALPWGGVRATLERATRHLFDIENSLSNGSLAVPETQQIEQQENVYDRARRGQLQSRPVRPISVAADESSPVQGGRSQDSGQNGRVSVSDDLAESRTVSGSLAGRIQMAPQPKSGRRGYAREIPLGKEQSQDTAGAK